MISFRTFTSKPSPLASEKTSFFFCSFSSCSSVSSCSMRSTNERMRSPAIPTGSVMVSPSSNRTRTIQPKGKDRVKDLTQVLPDRSPTARRSHGDPIVLEAEGRAGHLERAGGPHQTEHLHRPIQVAQRMCAERSEVVRQQLRHVSAREHRLAEQLGDLLEAADAVDCGPDDCEVESLPPAD